MDYSKTIDYLIKNTKLTLSEVFEFKGTPCEEYFEKLFQFYTGNLEYNKYFGTVLSYFVFYDQNKIFAEARKSKKHYIIAIDKKIIDLLLQWYNLYFDFVAVEGLEEFNLLEKELNFKISELLEQAYCTLLFL